MAERFMEETRSGLEPLLPFMESQKEFVDRLVDYGEIEPVLLTLNEGLVERIRHQPGLEWNALNVRSYFSTHTYANTGRAGLGDKSMNRERRGLK